MKILTAHNYYQYPGGEDVVFEQESSLLQKYGHQVFTYKRRNDELEKANLLSRLTAAAESVWSRATYSEFSEMLRQVAPDIVHVHNTSVRISPSIFSACFDAGIPAVHTLHNYRLLCPGTTLYRNGVPCEKCAGGNMWHGVTGGCYRSSRIATGVAASTIAYNRHRGTWKEAITHYIAPSRFVRAKLIAGGLPSERITVKAHFVDPDPNVAQERDEYAIYVGRLSPEKGLKTLLTAWEQLSDIPLRIVGEGPERSELEILRQKKKLNIRFQGQLQRAEVVEQVRRARLLVFPSLAFETFGMGIIEAYACGVPVIASNHGAMQELVQHGSTGLLFEPGNATALACCVRLLWSDHELLARTGRNARMEYEAHYTAARNYDAIMDIYTRVLTSPGPLATVGVSVPA